MLTNIREDTFSILSRERKGVTIAFILEKPLSHSALLTANVSTACLSVRSGVVMGRLGSLLKSLKLAFMPAKPIQKKSQSSLSPCSPIHLR